MFSKNIERIAYNNATANRDNIIKDILNGLSLIEIKDEYNTTRESLNRIVINYLNNPNYNKEILTRLDDFTDYFIPSHDRDFLLAKTAIKMFVDNKCCTSSKIYNHFLCPNQQLYQYLKILEVQNHPLYYEYRKIYKKEMSENATLKDNLLHLKEKIKQQKEVNKISTFSKEKLLNILTIHNGKDFVNYCLYYGFNTYILSELLKDNEELKYHLANANNKEMTLNVYNEYINRYRLIIKSLIRDIIILSKNKFKEPLDLYKYYKKTNFNIKYLAMLAESFKDIKNNTLIIQYLNRFPVILDYLTNKNINTIRQKDYFSCCNNIIKFNGNDLNNAMKSIEEDDMPLVKGVLYGALKNQLNNKDRKEKVKK